MERARAVELVALRSVALRSARAGLAGTAIMLCHRRMLMFAVVSEALPRSAVRRPGWHVTLLVLCELVMVPGTPVTVITRRRDPFVMAVPKMISGLLRRRTVPSEMWHVTLPVLRKLTMLPRTFAVVRSKALIHSAGMFPRVVAVMSLR